MRMNIESIGKIKGVGRRRRARKSQKSKKVVDCREGVTKRSRDLVAVPRRAAYVRKRMVGDSG